MNIENETIKINKNVCTLSQLQNIESDFVLPDYFADISKILKCTVVPFTEAVSVSGDKISVSGKVQFSLLYADENKKLYNFENEIKYTKIFQGQNVSISDNITASQYVTVMNYRAMGPKRIELKGSVQITVDVVASEDKIFVTKVDDENTYLKCENKKVFMPVTAVQRDFSINATVTPDNIYSSQLQCIVRKESKVSFSELKPISDKIFIKGEGIVNIFYLTQEGKMNNSVINIPFSEVIDLYQVREDDICRIENTEASVNVIIKENDDKCSFDVTLNIAMIIKAMREREICYINDIYSSSHKLNTEYDEYEICCKHDSTGKTFSGEAEVEIYDVQGEIIDSFADAIHITQEKSDDKNLIVISGNYNALIKRDDLSNYLISRSFTKEYEAVDYNTELYNNVKVKGFDVLSVSALQKGDDRIIFRSDIFVDFDVQEKCKIKMLTQLDADKSSNDEIKNRITLYYAKKNEDIWNIAKENNASITKIKNINNLETDILNEDKVLLLTNF